MTNTVKSGNGTDIYTICCGKNNIYSGGGNDKIYINNQSVYDGNEDGMPDYTSTGGGINIINSGTGNDYIEINQGINTIDTSAGNDNVLITSGENNINLGAGHDTVIITAGINAIQGAGGNDIYKFQTKNSSESTTVINDSAGNDVYDLSQIVNYDSLIKITDTKGKNSVIVNSDAFNNTSGIYFNVIVGAKPKFDTYGNNKYSLGTSVTLYEKLHTLSNGVEITGRTALNEIITDTDDGNKTYKLDINSVAQNVANFLANKGYESADACISKNNTASSDVINLLNLYNNTNNGGIDYCLSAT